jgi:hypothetical protein
MKKKVLWFKSKRYGWGWYPVTWQGWAVTGGFVLYVLLLSALIGNSLESREGLVSFLFLTFLGVVILLAICFKTGETPRWRWGK